MPDRPVALRGLFRAVFAAVPSAAAEVSPALPVAGASRRSVLSDTDWSFLIDATGIRSASSIVQVVLPEAASTWCRPPPGFVLSRRMSEGRDRSGVGHGRPGTTSNRAVGAWSCGGAP